MLIQTVLITGANTGLGYEVAKQLLTKGYGVIMACRNMEKALFAQKALIEQTGNTHVDILKIDLSSLSDIRSNVEKIYKPLSGLVCNAGVSHSNSDIRTGDGFEETFGVNHLGHFLLTNLLLKKFNTTLTRIAVVSSELHNPEKSRNMFPTPQFNSFSEMAYYTHTETQKQKRRGALCYVNAKLTNVVFTYALHDLLQASGRSQIFVNAISPGFVPGTGLGRDESAVMRVMLKNILPNMRLLMPEIASAKEAGQYISRLISDVSVSGNYFDRVDEVPSSALSYDKNLRIQLWEESVSLVGLLKNESVF